MPTTIPDYLPPLGDAITPPTGDITVPQSPSGVINTDTGRTESATQTALGLLEIEGTQQGTVVISSVSSITAGVPQAALQVNNFTGGSVGSTGNKFS